MRSLAMLLLLFSTASCTPAASFKNCLPLKAYTKQQQIQAATDLGNVPADSPVFDMIDDYRDLRTRIEVCRGIAPSKRKSQPNMYVPAE